MAETGGKTALVAGGSGLVGRHLIQTLSDAPEYSRVYALSRRPLEFDAPKLANRIVPFDRIESELKGVTAHDAFCCLGTTLKDAGSEAAFRKVDHDYVLAFARAAKAAGAQRFVFVSSIGAEAGSKHFYLRVKAETERDLAALGFTSFDVLQPSLLLGLRREARPLELLAMVFMPLAKPFLQGKYADYRAISASDVARAMYGAARSGRRGTYRYTYNGLMALAQGRVR